MVHKEVEDRLTWTTSRWIRRSRNVFRNSGNMFWGRIRVEVIRRGSVRYRIWAVRSLRCEFLKGRLEQVILELNLPLSLESVTHVGVHVKANMNRVNDCSLLRNVYPVGLL
jgi:hypothetical protein